MYHDRSKEKPAARALQEKSANQLNVLDAQTLTKGKKAKIPSVATVEDTTIEPFNPNLDPRLATLNGATAKADVDLDGPNEPVYLEDDDGGVDHEVNQQDLDHLKDSLFVPLESLGDENEEEESLNRLNSTTLLFDKMNPGGYDQPPSCRVKLGFWTFERNCIVNDP